jgi:hypothetical protein
MKLILTTIISIIILMIFEGCNNSPEPGEVHAMQYAFTGSSLSPEYHRSYTIKMDSSTIHVKVRNYDSILAEGEYRINPGSFKSLIP